MTKLTRTIIATAAAFSLLVPLAGCGSDEDTMKDEVSEEAAEEQPISDDAADTDADADTDTDTDTDTDEDSQSGTRGDDQNGEMDMVELPEDWPSDLPLPNDHLIVQVVDNGDSGRVKGFTVAFAAPGTTDVVAGQIREDMAAAGYQEQESGPFEQDAGGFTIEQTSYESAAHRVGVTVSDMSIPDVPEELGISVTYQLDAAGGQ